MAWTLGEVALIPPTQVWKCLRKVHHASYDEAEAHRLDVLLNHGSNGDPLHVYRCPHCNGWHVGRSQPWSLSTAMGPR